MNKKYLLINIDNEYPMLSSLFDEVPQNKIGLANVTKRGEFVVDTCWYKKTRKFQKSKIIFKDGIAWVRSNFCLYWHPNYLYHESFTDKFPDDFDRAFDEAAKITLKFNKQIPYLHWIGEPLIESNGFIFCDVEINLDEFIRYIKDNFEAFSTFVQNHCTSRDGFVSYLSNNPEDYFDVNYYFKDSLYSLNIDYMSKLFVDFYIQMEGLSEDLAVFIHKELEHII